MVGVEVREHDERNALHTEPAQAPVHRRRVRTRVHHHGRPPAGVEHQTVALAHVAGDHHPALRRPSRGRQREQQRTDHHPAQAQRGDPPGQQRAEEQGQRCADQRQGRDADRTGGPVERCHRQVRSPHGHGDDPPGAPRCGRGDDPTDRLGDQSHHTAGQPEDGRRSDGRGGQQVGADRDQADLTRDRCDERRAGDLGSQRHRHRLGHPAREPSHQPVPPPGRQPQDPGSGQHREGEAHRQCQPGVEEQQQEHRGAERPGAAATTVVAHPDQPDRTHGGRPDHAGLGTRKEHEADHPQCPDDRQALELARPPTGRAGAASPPRGSGWCRTPPAGGSGPRCGSPPSGPRASPRRHRPPGPAPAPAALAGALRPRRGSRSAGGRPSAGTDPVSRRRREDPVGSAPLPGRWSAPAAAGRSSEAGTPAPVAASSRRRSRAPGHAPGAGVLRRSPSACERGR